ncbi:hypothetical protein [Flavobacterium lacus]|uniref:Uncharacterized protein n=1 Tax=Flavobacterium lacus TaxID=1353778 RepID=A0A328WTP2_9FLAO|nr:hypothetical protein [Flavobacterium lacus]RAR47214.1 hypothetical protein B0I10_1107 [Flavobacterium lacus]
MKKHISNQITTIYVFLFSLSTISLYADDFDPGFPIGNDPGQEAPATPIDGWVPFMLVVAIGLLFYYNHKTKSIKN